MNQSHSSFATGIWAGVACLTVVIAAFFLSTPNPRRYPVVTPQVTVIVAPTLQLTQPVTPALEPTPTLERDIPPDPGNLIQVGISVRISGTGGQGLRLRQDASRNATPLFLGAENEVFTVKDGPRSADGFTWWYLQAPYDETRAGWAVSNYLLPVE